MRVISGKARGLKLRAPEGNATRPTADRIKETLFNVLAPDLPGCNFLDIFSGTGAIGIEALSRGAENAVFIESASPALDIIDFNLRTSKFTENAEVINRDFVTALTGLGAAGKKFDIIFMDPPYFKGFVREALEIISTLKILSDDGYIVIEQGVDEEAPDDMGFALFKIKKISATALLFLKRE